MSNQQIPAVVVVTFPTPKEVDRAAMRALIEEAGPKYTSIPGLRRKYFLAGEGIGGGVYEWDSRQNAEAFYDESWHEEVKKRFGAVPQVDIYDAAGIADGVEHQLEVF